MKTLVYSVLIDVSEPQLYMPAELDAMFDLWVKHLKGPGDYNGEILILTNRPGFQWHGVKVVQIERAFENTPDAEMTRVLKHTLVPSENYDSILYLDLDILAMDKIQTLFADDERMWVSPSNIRTLDREHTWQILGVLDKIRYGALSPRQKSELGVSSCVFSTTGGTWTCHMRTWEKVIKAHIQNHPVAPLAEQSYLNLAYLKKLIPMKIYERNKILHHSWTMDSSPILWHFAGCPDRPNVMAKWSRLASNM